VGSEIKEEEINRRNIGGCIERKER